MAITDTSPEAAAVQLQIQKAMTGEQRLLLALEMSLFARELARTCIRQSIQTGRTRKSSANFCGKHSCHSLCPAACHMLQPESP